MGDRLFHIVSLKWTKRGDPYITVWRENDRGYAWPLEWAGVYTKAAILGDPAYNDHRDTMAVPANVLEGLAVLDHEGYSDPVSRETGQRGRCVPNTRRNWQILRAAALVRAAADVS